jgi:hypothetical protein
VGFDAKTTLANSSLLCATWHTFIGAQTWISQISVPCTMPFVYDSVSKCQTFTVTGYDSESESRLVWSSFVTHVLVPLGNSRMETTLVIDEMLRHFPWEGHTDCLSDLGQLSSLTKLDIGLPDIPINGGTPLLEWVQVIPKMHGLTSLKIRGVVEKFANAADTAGLRIVSERLGTAIHSLLTLTHLSVADLDMDIARFLEGFKGLNSLEVCPYFCNPSLLQFFNECDRSRARLPICEIQKPQRRILFPQIFEMRRKTLGTHIAVCARFLNGSHLCLVSVTFL